MYLQIYKYILSRTLSYLQIFKLYAFPHLYVIRFDKINVYTYLCIKKQQTTKINVRNIIHNEGFVEKKQLYKVQTVES